MKTSEAANLVFQWIFVLNSVKHKFFPVSIVNLVDKTDFKRSDKYVALSNLICNIDVKNFKKSYKRNRF